MKSESGWWLRRSPPKHCGIYIGNVAVGYETVHKLSRLQA